MNTTGTRHTASILATATALAAALTLVSAIAPTAATADRPDSIAGPATQCFGNVGSVSSAGTDSILEIAGRKAQMAQHYVDHAEELYRLAAR